MTAADNKRSTNRRFAAGQVLMREGERGGDLWFLRSGEVEIYRERGSRTFVLARCKEGEMLGTMTATTGRERTASVRAVSDVEVTVVPEEQVQKLIKDIPTWANAFIKDLVTRVLYANELYIEAETVSHAFEGSPLQFAKQVASAFVSMAELLAEEWEGMRVVSVGGASARIAEVLGRRQEIDAIFAQFFYHEVLVKVSGPGEGSYVPFDRGLELGFFAETVQKTLATQTPDTPFTMPLAKGERALLEAIVRDYASDNRGSGADEYAVPFSTLEERFRKDPEVRFDLEALKRAQTLGLVGIDRTGDEPRLSFSANWLDLALRSLRVIRDLAVPKGPQRKKTLLY